MNIVILNLYAQGKTIMIWKNTDRGVNGTHNLPDQMIHLDGEEDYPC